jgi:hypothetical protein
MTRLLGRPIRRGAKRKGSTGIGRALAIGLGALAAVATSVLVLWIDRVVAWKEKSRLVRKSSRELEDRSFASLYVPEHTHIPTSRRTWREDRFTASAAHIRDPFVSLSFAAAATEKLLVGTSVCLIPQHDPSLVAKEPRQGTRNAGKLARIGQIQATDRGGLR